DDADRIAVLRFDNQAEGVGAAGTLQPVGTGENRRRLTEALQPPDDYFRRGYTRIDLGLQSAIDLLQNARQPGRSQYVLLLTDGEPSQQLGAGDQRERINGQIETLRNAGVIVFPVVLCNPTAGCAGEFLRDRFAESGVREAKNAQDLVRIFSEIFASMKSDRSVLTGRSADGALEFTTRVQQGVRRITVVTPSGGLRGVNRSDGAVATQSTLSDPHIDVNVLEGTALTEGGDWRIETSDFSGFAVIQTDSYPQLVNPPPSVASSPGSVRYYPAGKPLLLLARSSGPGAGEPLLYNGKTPLPAFGESDLKMLLLNDDPKSIRLQVGNDKTPLQLIRTFDLEARRDLPPLQVLSPSANRSGVQEDGHARLQITFGGNSALQNMSAIVLITDESDDDQGGGKLAYQATMSCLDRTCVDEGFTPGDGRSYQVTYVAQAQQEGLRFSDWAQAGLGLKPAVYLRGLAPEYDLAQMPSDGWQLEVSSGTTEEIGNLVATLNLRRLESDEAAVGTKLSFAVDVPEEGVITTPLLV
ncbi:MAG TPA: vWA domain-containing protein, partial [Caldilineaceae bacterium]|nr:vWA domain-containing protein [Caldilineaceae bacterium]